MHHKKSQHVTWTCYSLFRSVIHSLIHPFFFQKVHIFIPGDLSPQVRSVCGLSFHKAKKSILSQFPWKDENVMRYVILFRQWKHVFLCLHVWGHIIINFNTNLKLGGYRHHLKANSLTLFSGSSEVIVIWSFILTWKLVDIVTISRQIFWHYIWGHLRSY